MELWELIKRLLAAANGGGQTFSPGIIAGQYERELLAAQAKLNQTHAELIEISELLGEQLQASGLIRPAGVRRGGAAILGAMERTDFGEELYQTLRGRNVVQFFEGMQAEVDAGEIRRLLHQLSS
ncbi:hypothetical protein [Pseudomonas citronellolis]|uniref:hypothetical protein n=1 Tax=Pseudomonas citronellolis TaxID=53408 RepID=UPI001080A86B|nr:hypothetical protein [Pseudomonas citronellolis]